MISDHEKLFNILKRLIYADAASSADLAAALQICFDLYDNCLQSHLSSLIGDLQAEASMKTAELVASGYIDVSSEAKDGAFLTKTGEDYRKLPYLDYLHRMVTILNGSSPNKLQLDFMVKALKYDTHIIASMQEGSVLPTAHTATAVCNAFIHLGTSSDALIRSNVEWLSWSIAWGRFIMVSSLGLIYRGHGETALRILSPYLPGYVKENPSPFQEGGALYAVGLAFSNYGASAIHHFLPYLTPSTHNIILHGACLGVGLASLGSCNEDLYSTLLSIIRLDDAISSEAAALACGLVMLSSNDINRFSELKEIISSTKHEKIQRALALSLSMFFAEQSKAANEHIELLLSDKTPHYRMAGVFTIATAYAGTNDPYAVKLLWKTACSDSNDDVKRVSLVALGLVMYRNPEQLLGIAVLFIQTHNPHLRSGALLALGIAFAGSGNEKICSLIKSLLVDPTLIVRQYRAFRNGITSLCTDRRSDNIAKFGAHIAYGIMDAGGRNLALVFSNSDGRTRIQSIVGFLVFQQFWFWFPLVHFISLCFVPSCIILLNTTLEVPSVSFDCDVDTSLFASPSTPETALRDSFEKIRHPQLSHSLRSRGKRRIPKDLEVSHHFIQFTTSRVVALKKIRNSKDSKDAPEKASSIDDAKVSKKSSKTSEKISSAEGKAKEKSINASSKKLMNPVRVHPSQLKHMKISSSSLPLETVKELSCGGIILTYNENSNDDAKKENSSQHGTII